MTNLRLNTTSNENVQVDEHDIEDVESFMYLGAYISKSGGKEDDIKARLGKKRAAYSKLDKIWKNSQFTYKTKMHIVSWIRSGKTVNLPTRLRSKFSNLISSRCCCMVANAGE